MEANTQKKDTLIKREPPESLEIIELDDTVLGSVVGGANNPNRPPGPDNNKHPFPGRSRYAFQ